MQLLIKMKSQRRVLAAVGAVLWLISIASLDYANNHNLEVLNAVLTGYMLGYVTVFSWFCMKELFFSKGKSLFSRHPLGRAFEIFSLGALLILAGMGVYLDLFGDTTWHFQVAFAIAGVAVNAGLIPHIREVDGLTDQAPTDQKI